MSALAILGMNAACGATNTVTFLCFQLPWGPSSAAKILTAVLFWVISLIAFVLHGWGPEKLLRLQKGGDGLCDLECLRYYIVLRIMTMLAIFHGVQALLLIGVRSSKQSRAFLQTGLWPVKGILLLTGVFGAFLLPQPVIDYSYMIGVVLSAVFILMQVILLVDLACSWAETLVSKYEETEGAIYKWALIILTILFYASVLVGAGFLFFWYPKASERMFTCGNVFISILMTVLSLSSRVQEAHAGAGVFPAAFLSTYNLFLLTSAFLSEPGAIKSDGSPLSTAISTIAYMFAFLSIGYSAYSSGKKSDKLTSVGKTISSSSVGKGEEDELEYNHSLFHVIFMCAAFYVALVMTRWKQPVIEAGVIHIRHMSIAFWVKLVTSWIQAALYIWTLFAPIVLADREFV